MAEIINFPGKTVNICRVNLSHGYVNGKEIIPGWYARVDDMVQWTSGTDLFTNEQRQLLLSVLDRLRGYTGSGYNPPAS